MAQASTGNDKPVVDLRDKEIEGPIYEYLLREFPFDDYILKVSRAQCSRLYTEMSQKTAFEDAMEAAAKITKYGSFQIEVTND